VAAEFDITVRTDRDFYLPVTVVTALGNPANLTGYQIEMTVKAHQTDTDSAALYKGSPWLSKLPFGQFTFHIPRTQNSSWWQASGGPISMTIVYDVACLDIAIPPNMVTLLEGGVTLIGPVTQTIP
jgi:hypothetical protein